MKAVLLAGILVLDISSCIMAPHSALFELWALVNGAIFGFIVATSWGRAHA